jgi:hypothetical protein
MADIGPAPWFVFDFTDEQWNGLVRLSGELPQDARTEFKDCIISYRLSRRFHFDHEPEGRDQRERLRNKVLKVTKDSEWKGAIASLEGLDMYDASGKPPPPIGQLLDRLLNFLVRKLEYRNLQVSENSSRPGPKSSQPNYRFIADAAALLEKYTQPATRSEKAASQISRPLLRSCAKSQIQRITSGTVDEALKRYITRTRSGTPW